MKAHTTTAKELAKNTTTTVNGKIILVDDEKYEKELLMLALREKQWDVKVEYFNNGNDALEHMRTTKDKLFLVISDMNMPEMTGLELKKAIDEDKILREKSMPFIFMSGGGSNEEVSEAYDYRVQGFFEKPKTVGEQAEVLDLIIKYWIVSLHPEKKK
ncbi:MAG: response regulator [Bacteroidia bacterium]|nr:response regulator [Bacteroidia bacterium]